MPLRYSIYGDIKQLDNEEKIYFDSKNNVDMVIRIYNFSSSAANIEVTLKNKEGKIIDKLILKPKQQKSIYSKNITTLSIKGLGTGNIRGYYDGYVYTK